jgi:Tfp pilus assembly protein PilV
MAIKKKRIDSGFTILEVICATLVVTVGMLALLSLFALATTLSTGARLDTQARDQAQQIVESIFAARNAGSLSFNAIQNQSTDSVNGVFVDGYQNMYQPGPDGIPGTTDDVTSSLQTDAAGNQITNLKRQVLIQAVFLADGVTQNPNVRRLTVNMQYVAFGKTRTYSQQTYISTYR